MTDTPSPSSTTSPISQTLGPGTLSFGPAGSGKDFSSRTTKTEFAPEAKTEDPKGLLNGDDYQPEPQWGGTISGTFYQEYGSDSLIAWCYTHAGEIIDFVFIPKTGAGLAWKGKCIVAPVKVGGDAKKTNETDFSFQITGDKPTMGTPESVLS